MNVEELIGNVTERSAEDLHMDETPAATVYETERPPCQEPGCGKPCRKRRGTDDYFPYCALHNAQHAGSTPKSQGVKNLEVQRKKNAEKVTEKFTEIGQAIQLAMIGSGDLYCAKAIGDEWESIAQAVGDLSVEFKWIGEGVEAVSKWGTLAVLTLHLVKLGAAIGVHHGAIPYEGPVKFLVVNPNQPFMATPQEATVVNGNGATNSL